MGSRNGLSVKTLIGKWVYGLGIDLIVDRLLLLRPKAVSKSLKSTDSPFWNFRKKIWLIIREINFGLVPKNLIQVKASF